MAHRDCGSGLVNLDLFVHLIYVASLSFHQKLLLLIMKMEMICSWNLEQSWPTSNCRTRQENRITRK